MKNQLSASANILFNKDLYNKTGPVILQYLNYQANVLDKYIKGSTPALTTEELTDAYGSNVDALITVLFTGDYDVLDLETSPVPGRALQGLDNIKANINICFGHGTLKDIDAKETASVEKIWVALSAFDLKTKVKALQYLVSTFSETEAMAKNLSKILSDADILSTDNVFTLRDVPKFANIKKKFNIVPADLEKIITGLIAKIKGTTGE